MTPPAAAHLAGKRILQLANQPGPLRLFMLPVCRRLREAGARVELACMKTGANWQPLTEAGFPLHELSPGGWSSPATWWRAYRQVRRLLLRQHYDLMVVHTPAMSWLARLAARDCVPSVMYMAHGLPFAPRQNPLMRWLFRRIECFVGRRYTDGLMVMNRADAQAAARLPLVRPGGKWFLIPGVGVDAAQWSGPLPDARRAELDRQFSLRPEAPLVLYLGRFIATKRPGDVLELARRAGPSVDFLLAGEGPLWEAIRRQAGRIGPHVRVLGWTDLAEQLVRRSSLVVFPSVFREGLPRLLLEAQAAGRAVVAYDVRGSQDALLAGASGVLVPPGDVDQFCKQCLRLLADEPLRRSMGEAGRARVQAEFSLARSVQAQMQAIEQVLAARD